MDASKYLTDPESEALKASLLKHTALKHNIKTRMDATMLLVLWHLGCRVSELVKIKRSDLHRDSRRWYVKLHATKGSNNRELPVSEEVTGLIDEYLKMLGMELGSFRIEDDQRLFRMAPANVRRIWYLYRTAKKKLHALRHSRAIEIYKKTRDIHLVKYSLGHKAINSTMEYVSFIESRENLLKIL